jgi:hypothetical protein
MRTCGGSVATERSGISPSGTEVLLVLSARREHPKHRCELAVLRSTRDAEVAKW